MIKYAELALEIWKVDDKILYPLLLRYPWARLLTAPAIAAPRPILDTCRCEWAKAAHMYEDGKIHQNETSLCVCVCPWWRQSEGCRARGRRRMECSWKTVLLLVCASLGVQYTAIRTLRDSLSGPCQGAYRCQTRHHRGTSASPTYCASCIQDHSKKKVLSVDMYRYTLIFNSKITPAEGTHLTLDRWC